MSGIIGRMAEIAKEKEKERRKIEDLEEIEKMFFDKIKERFNVNRPSPEYTDLDGFNKYLKELQNKIEKLGRGEI